MCFSIIGLTDEQLDTPYNEQEHTIRNDFATLKHPIQCTQSSESHGIYRVLFNKSHGTKAQIKSFLEERCDFINKSTKIPTGNTNIVPFVRLTNASAQKLSPQLNNCMTYLEQFASQPATDTHSTPISTGTSSAPSYAAAAGGTATTNAKMTPSNRVSLLIDEKLEAFSKQLDTKIKSLIVATIDHKHRLFEHDLDNKIKTAVQDAIGGPTGGTLPDGQPAPTLYQMFSTLMQAHTSTPSRGKRDLNSPSRAPNTPTPTQRLRPSPPNPMETRLKHPPEKDKDNPMDTSLPHPPDKDNSDIV